MVTTTILLKMCPLVQEAFIGWLHQDDTKLNSECKHAHT